MKKLILLLFVFLCAQTSFSQRKMENLDRGLVAAKVTGGVYVNWRITGQEWYDVSYNLYRNGTKVNGSPITGASNLVDAAGTLSSTYQVAAIVDGVEQAMSKSVSVLPNPYIEFELHPIPKIAGVPDSYYTQYIINDIVTADLDGDGEYELIIKRINEGYDSSKPYENHYYTLFDAYKLDGTFLWRVDVGPNIFHNVEINMMAFDYDGDGKAELVTRFSEGSKVLDKNLNVIYEIGDEGNANGDPIPDGKTNYRNSFQNNTQYFEWEGPEYLALMKLDDLNQNLEVLDRIDHIQRKQPGYNNGAYWGSAGQSASQLAHRACKYHYGAPYLDGKNPSILVTRGIYGRIIMRTYDIVNKKFQSKWEWKSDNEAGNYSGQGNHNYSIADVDGDGCDEIVYGQMTVNNDGTGMYTTGLGHGDAIHVGDLDPYRKGLEIFGCLENSPYHGAVYRAAEDGTILLQYIANDDTGRCMAANVSDQYKGAEMWPSATGSFSASEMKETTFPTDSWNFRIFWDGDLKDELLDHDWNKNLGKGIGDITKYNDTSRKWETLLTSDGYYSCNHSKGTPCLQADLFGDWREEVIWRSGDDTKIRIYFTTIPTEHRIYTLMHDMQYRQAIGWQMCGYNQPPHVSYFLGEAEGILLPPPPVMDNQRLVFQPTSSSWSMGSSNWKKDGQDITYTDNTDVLFDVSGHVSGNISVTGTVSPRTVTVNSKDDYAFNMTAGKLSGSMRFIKQGRGTMTFNGNHDYTGATDIWDGRVDFDGQLTGSPVWINLHAELAAKGTIGKSVSMNYGSVLYPGGKNLAGALAIGEDLLMKENSVIEFDVANDASLSDKITLTTGKLKLTEENAVVRINTTTGNLAVGNYMLISAPQGIEGDLSKVKIEGLGDQIGKLSLQGNDIVLTIEAVRSANTITWTGSNSGSIWNVFDQQNFTLSSANTYFTTGDNVVFDDTSVSQTVNLADELAPASIVVNADKDYTFEGNGKLTGATSLTKEGAGKLTIRGTNDFSGAVTVKEGTLAIETFPNLVNNGSIGIVSNDPSLFVVDGGTITSIGGGLKVSSRALHIGDGGATINTNSAFRWMAPVSGGVLTKTGTSDLAFYGNNTFNKLILEAGSVSLKSSSASAGNDIILGNNTTFSHYGSSSANFEVKDGATSRINLSSNGTYSGKLTGNGTLTINIPYVRENLTGDWSAFSGKLNVVTNIVHSSWSAEMRFSNTRGLPNADLNVTGKIYVHHLSSGSVALGGLNGTSDATLNLGNTWTIGSTNTNTAFAGLVSGGGRITKVGTGIFKLSNANTYTGTTTISGGRLQAMNTTGSATGTGKVTINNAGTLGGTGIIGGAVDLMRGGTIEPGDETSTSWNQRIGTLTINGATTVYAGGKIKLTLRKRLVATSNDKIVFNGAVTIAGDLEVDKTNDSYDFVIGDEFKLFDFNRSVSRQFANITLPELPQEMMWDTDNLTTTGVIKVVPTPVGIFGSESNVLSISPNPADDYIVIELPVEGIAAMNVVDLTGAVVMTQEITSQERIDVTSLPKGMYVVRINVDGKAYVSKLIKK